MASTKPARAAQMCAQTSILILAASLLAGCSGGSTQALYPATPKWSLTDKQPLGGAQNAPAQDSSAQQYEYRGGRDPATGQARTTQGASVPRQGESARSVSAAASREASLAPSRDPAARTVEIHKGDTLHGLSLQHHVSVKALMEANNLTTTTIRPGQKLVIPAS
jgi:LysM repeat protein